MSKKNKQDKVKTGFVSVICGVTFIVLLALKLLGLIVIPWFWVFAPLIIWAIVTISIVLILVVPIYVMAVLAALVE
jgi:hypothetical protein